MDKHIVVLVTTPSQEVGEQIAGALLEQRLAASVNIIPAVTSLFTWQGRVEHAQEVLLVIKSRAGLFQERLIPLIQEIHPYEVPQIIALPIVMGAESYLNWLDEVTIPPEITGR